MRVRRHKNHRRILRFFRLAYGVQEPYHVVVDGTFLTHALQNKIHVKEQLPKLMEARATPMITGCVLAELRALGERALGAAIIAKNYYRLKCKHNEPVAAADCIREQIAETNERRLIVATQDPELLQALRQVPGVPLLRLHGQVPQLEEPSNASKGRATAEEAKKLQPATWEKTKLPELKAKEVKAKAMEERPKKRRGPKGPNPLSCLKSKRPKKPGQPNRASVQEEVKKPKRVRSRKMGTRTKAAAEELLQAAGGSGLLHSLGQGGTPEEPHTSMTHVPKRRRRR